MITREELVKRIVQSEVHVLNIDSIIFDKSLYSRTNGIDPVSYTHLNLLM